MSKKYVRPQSTISTIIIKKDLLIDKYQNNLIQPNQKRIRGSIFSQVEEALDHRFQSTLSLKNITIDGPIIQAQAMLIKPAILNYASWKIKNSISISTLI